MMDQHTNAGAGALVAPTTSNATGSPTGHVPARSSHETRGSRRVSSAAFGATVLVWIAVFVRYGRAPIALSPDSMNNYAHVWWLGDGIWNHGVWRWAMPAIGHGSAITYPYGFINWTTASLVWPLLGDYATTIWTIVGAAGCVIGSWCAFPELRRGWWRVALLLNPAIVQSLLFGQQSFAWASMFFLFGVAAWRRDRRWMATVLVGLAQLNHAAIVMPIVVVAIALRWWSEPDRRALLRHYLISVLIAIPAVVAVVASPAFSDSSPRDRLVNFFSTLGPRVLIVVLPMVLVMWARSGSTRLAILGVVCMLGANVALHFPLHVELGWRTLRRTPRPESMQHFLHSNAFQQSHMYRVLRGGDSKLGAYLLLKAGGRLDSEFFPESMALKNFVSPQEYAALLCARRVDMVIAFHSYDATRHMNEHAMLARLEVGVTQPVGWPTASVATHSVDSLAGYEGYEAFSVERRGC